MYTADIIKGEKLVITSDGIHDNLTNQEITQILSKSQNSQMAVTI